MIEITDHQVFGHLIEMTLSRRLTLDDRANALDALATLAEILDMEEEAAAATAAREAVAALDAAQLRLSDYFAREVKA